MTREYLESPQPFAVNSLLQLEIVGRWQGRGGTFVFRKTDLTAVVELQPRAWTIAALLGQAAVRSAVHGWEQAYLTADELIAGQRRKAALNKGSIDPAHNVHMGISELR